MNLAQAAWIALFIVCATEMAHAAPELSANSPGDVRYLATPRAALRELIDTIREAKYSVDMDYYIFSTCSISCFSSQ